MRVSSAAFIFWLSGIRLWTIPKSGVWGQYFEDDSIDDKITTTDDDDDPPTGTGWCEFGQGRLSKMRSTQNRSPKQTQTSRTFFLLVYTGIFLATRYCMLVDPDWRRYWFYTQARRLCWLGFNNLGCICRERGLIRAIRNNRKNAAICSGTWITVSKEIDVTGKNFEISCQARNFGACRILGNSRTRLLKGSPKPVRFHEIEFGEFSATEGGVALFTGGKTRFESCDFYSNEATVGNGGALHITNGAHVDLIDTSLSINSAINGNKGAVSITGANSTLTYDRISMGNN
jgi:hypothetical protein